MLNVGQIQKGKTNRHLMQKMGWQMVNLRMETRNAFENWHQLEEQRDKRVFCMSDIPKGSGPILIVMSGSSTNLVMPRIKEWPGAIMCSTSHVSTLVHEGRPPDYTVCIDPRVATPDTELDAPDFGDGVMLAHPSVPEPYISRWLDRAKGNIYLARIMEYNYDWYTHHLPQGYPWIRHIMLPMIDSLASAVSMATWLGYGPIFLSGVDYTGPRFNRWDYDMETGEWSEDRVTSGYVAQDVGNFNGMTAATAMSYSSRGALLSIFMQIANEKYKQRIYQLSPETAIHQVPFVNWAKLLENPDDLPPFDREAIMDDIECAMAAWDTFIVRKNSGWGTDYHVFIADSEPGYVSALMSENNGIMTNKAEYGKIEESYNKPLADLIRDGTVSIEAGELLIHPIDEFQEWDWHSTEPIDVAATLARRNWLLKEYPKRGYSKPVFEQAKEDEKEGLSMKEALDATIAELKKEKPNASIDEIKAYVRDKMGLHVDVRKATPEQEYVMIKDTLVTRISQHTTHFTESMADMARRKIVDMQRVYMDLSSDRATPQGMREWFEEKVDDWEYQAFMNTKA